MNTIDTILKLSGHKDINSFYKEFPDEASFQAKHGKAFAKAQRGAKIKKAQQGYTGKMSVPDLLALGSPEQESPLKLEPWMTETDKGAFPMRETFSPIPPIGPSNDISELGKIAEGIPILGKFVKAAHQFKQEHRENEFAEQWRDVSKIQKKAAQSIDVDANRPNNSAQENFYSTINSGDAFFPVYGTGDPGVLAKKGISIPKAQFGTQVGDIIQQIGGDRLTNISRHVTGDTAGGALGEAVGDAVGMIPGVGPVIKAVASPVLRLAGNFIGMRQRKKTKDYQNQTAQNINTMAMGKGMQGLFNTNNAYMASGGNVSNMENEGELRIGKGGAKSLSYNPFLPDGGETIEFTGPSHAEGGIPVSYGNSPVEVEGGEPAIKLQNGGTDEDLVVFGDLTVPGTKQTFKSVVKDLSEKEAKRNKEAEKALLSIEDLSPTNSFDKLKINSAKATLMGTTQKLKGYADEKQQLASLQEAINQTAEEMNVDANALSKGKYKMAKKGAIIPKAQSGIKKPQYRSGLAKLLGIEAEPGYNERERSIGNWFMRHSFPPVTWEDVPTIQNEVNTKSPVPTIAPGSFPNIPIIGTQSPYLSPDTGYVNPNVLTPKNPQLYHEPIVPHNWDDEIAMKYNQGNVTSNTSTKEKPSTKKAKKLSKLDQAVAEAVAMQSTLREPDTQIPALGEDEYKPTIAEIIDYTSKENVDDGEEKKKGWEYAIDALNAYLPYFRPSDTERLDPRQLMGEMFALTDKEEPVQAQFFQPQLGSPYSISFADQKNDVIAQVRSAQRMAGNNPAAQAMIASQAAQALNKINAKEFRMNQGMADKVYGENRTTMNQAQLQNLQIADNQYTRQSQAKSNTKARLQAALNSISDKYLKNELNNKILTTYENLYNYRFDDRGRKQNWNQPAQWEMEGSDGGYGVADPNSEWVTQWEKDPKTGEDVQVRRRRKTKKEQEATSIPAKNGMNIARAIKSL